MIRSLNDYIRRRAMIDYLLKSEERNNNSGMQLEAAEDLRLIGVISNDNSVIPSEDVAEIKRGIWISTSKHLWEKDESGEVNEWSWDREFHNGVTCELCGQTECVGCNPDYDNLTNCKPHYICSECGAEEPKEYPFCHCGARMTSGSFIKEGVIP